MSFPLWITTHLENIVLDTQPGFAQRPNQASIGIPQLRTNNVSRDGNLDFSGIKYVDANDLAIEKYGVRKGDIIFNNTNSPELVGKTALFNLNSIWVLSNHITRIRVDPDLADAEYLSRYLHHLWQIGASKQWAKQWVNQAAIDQPSLRKFDIPLPPLPEQQYIAEILRKADLLIQWRRKANEKVDVLQKLLFYKIFGNPGNLQTMEWDFERIDSFAQVTYGIGDRLDLSISANNGTRILTISNVTIDGFLDLSIERFSAVSDRKLRDATLENGDLLFNWRNGSEEHIGKTAIWENNLPGRTAHVSFLLKIHPNPEKANPYYLWVLLNILRSNGFFRQLSREQVNKKFNASELSELKLPLPPKPLQDEFANKLLEWRRIKESQVLSEKKFNSLFQSISTRAFLGELTEAWREKHKEELQSAAVERDKKLGLRGEVATLKDAEEGRLTPEEEELFRQALGQFAVNATKLLEPMRQSMLKAINPLFEMNKNIFEPLLQSIRQSLQAAVSVQLPKIPPISNESVLRYIDNLPVPQEKRAVIETLDTTTIRVLKLAGTHPAYFTANDLEAGEFGGITTLQAETSLRTLQALGFVKLVQIDGLLRYRLTVENDYGDLPYTLQP